MDYLETNRAAWDVRTAQHLDSEFYDVPGWLAGATSLKEIELDLLGEVDGERILHLQCHFGQDTLSLARLGAEVTGLDLSPAAIAAARELAKRAELRAKFVCGDVYAAPELLTGEFDTVFTSYGTTGWLPDLRAWAEVVAGRLRPGGRFVFVEFHPVSQMYGAGFTEVKYSYFGGAASVEVEGTYTDVVEELPMATVWWDHSLAEVIGGLLEAGLTLERFAEYDYSPYNLYGERGVSVGAGRFAVSGLEGRVPLCYSLVCRKS